MRSRRNPSATLRRIARAAGLSLALLLTACGGGGGGGGGGEIEAAHAPDLSNFSYSPMRVALQRGTAVTVMGQADFADAGSDITKLHLAIGSGAPDVIDASELKGHRAGSVTLMLDVLTDEPGTYGFSAWLSDSFGQASNRVGGSVDFYVDDSGSRWRPTASFYNEGPGHDSLAAVTWDGTRYIGVGPGGTVRSSSDGSAWTLLPTPFWHRLTGIASSGTQYVAAGVHATTQTAILLSSPDAVNWTARWEGAAFEPKTINAVLWTGGQFVAVGSETRWPGGNDYLLVLTSPDGIAWTQRAAGEHMGHMASLADSGSVLLAVGDNQTAYGEAVAWVSSDGGAHWTSNPMPRGASRVVWGRGRFVAASWITWPGPAMMVSTDGVAWQQAPIGDALQSLASGPGRYLGISWTGSVYASTDGLQWTATGAVSGECRDGLTWDGIGYIGVGRQVCQSP